MGVRVDADAGPVTSVQQTRDGNAVLVSTLDSTIRLMDKGNGNLLQSYRGHTNTDYRIRSCLGLADAAVISGSEDGFIYAWDLLEGKVIERLKAHDGKVASAVAFNDVRKEWASAGVDCELRVWWKRKGTDDVQVLSACGVCHNIRRSCRESGGDLKQAPPLANRATGITPLSALTHDELQINSALSILVITEDHLFRLSIRSCTGVASTVVTLARCNRPI